MTSFGCFCNKKGAASAAPLGSRKGHLPIGIIAEVGAVLRGKYRGEMLVHLNPGGLVLSRWAALSRSVEIRVFRVDLGGNGAASCPPSIFCVTINILRFRDLRDFPGRCSFNVLCTSAPVPGTSSHPYIVVADSVAARVGGGKDAPAGGRLSDCGGADAAYAQDCGASQSQIYCSGRHQCGDFRTA